MSFLFEIQPKKTGGSGSVKKQVSMDVRVPNPTAYHSQKSKIASQKFSFSKNSSASPIMKRMDGFKVPAQSISYQSLYAKRVQEMTLFQQTKKTKVKKRFAFALPEVPPIFKNLQSITSLTRFSWPKLTPNKLIYGSVMSGVAFGMVSLGLIEKTFESDVNAANTETKSVETISLETENYIPQKDVFMQYFSDAADAEYQAGVREMVKDYPIEEMLPYIFTKDRVTAAFLIGIAKKESNWGKRRPVLDGQDCFNYWGYRGQRRLMGSGGHTCFNSREDAVDTVAKRLDTLIQSERLNTPDKLIVWKCGMSCEGHSRESVQKWISDVDAYYSEMMALEAENTEIEDIEEGS